MIYIINIYSHDHVVSICQRPIIFIIHIVVYLLKTISSTDYSVLLKLHNNLPFGNTVRTPLADKTDPSEYCITSIGVNGSKMTDHELAYRLA